MLQFRRLDQPALFMIMSCIIIITLYIYIYKPAEDQQATLLLAADANVERAKAEEDLLHHEHQYRVAVEAAQHALGPVRINKDASNAVSSLLVDADRIARERHVSLIEMAPERSTTDARGFSLTMSCHGSYDDLLQYLADLSSLSTPIEIQTIDLRRDDQPLSPGITPGLDAIITMTMTTQEIEGSTNG